MTTLFDFLPLDVINYVIRPYLSNDYFARIAVNALLPPIDRQGNPLRQDVAILCMLRLNLIPLKKLIDNATWAEGPLAKAEAIVELFEFLIHNPLILQHNFNFRNTALRQANTFADTDCHQYTLLEEQAKATLIDKSLNLLELMAKTPFLYQLNVPVGDEKWSSVYGAGPCVVVDNSKALVLTARKENALRLEAEMRRRSNPHWTYVSYRGNRYDDDEDYGGEWQYGYVDSSNNWVLIEDDTRSYVSRRGTVKQDDGWERVVSRKKFKS